MTLMQKLAKDQNQTILMVTHNNRILDRADRIINLVGGRLESDEVLNTVVSSHSPNSDKGTFIF